MVHAVEDDAHALPGGDESGDADEPAKEGKNTPSPASGRKSDDEIRDETGGDGEDTQATGEDDTGSVAVADGPADEVRVSLSAQGVLDGCDDGAKGGRVSRVLQCVEKSLLLTRRQVELARRVVGDVDGDDTGDLIAVWLGGDCRQVSLVAPKSYEDKYML